MIAVDTNILVYAHREDSPHHRVAKRCLERLTQSVWAIPWPCVHEFYAVVTRSRNFDAPTPPARAIDQIDAWLESPSLVLLSEGDRHWSELRPLLAAGRTAGLRIHDARIVAICLEHGVSELWTADKDFVRFAGLKSVNPLMDAGKRSS